MNCNLSCLKCDLSCFKCNHGGFSQNSHRFVHVIWLSIVVWIFSIVAVADCSFARAGSVNTDYSDLAETGLFSYNLASDEHQCVSFSNTVNHSAAMKTARAFGVICCLLTSFIMLQALSLRLILQHQRTIVWKTTRIQAILAPLAQVLTFTAFGDNNCSGSNVKCVPGAAGVIAIFNIFFLIALACICWFAIPPEHPLFEIKRLETPATPEPKLTTVEDMESEHHHSDDDVEAQSDRESVYKNDHVDDDAAVQELDQVVKAVSADSEFTVRSLRPISPDSEKRRHTFSTRHSPVRNKLEKGEGSPTTTTTTTSQLAEV
eukprot:CAMPEP_0202509512 /NCGR_PEP_ID=MMETSP1361-20130828/52811_1 /ASSEMBLY_ACC=CAM_ASM_000849 /TAXON_ID=210615 /ORGANISM="Staurosira complex sp., Strain CCMP2646" /LENGTH=317 /DNA_ID=CAMNT_0049143735 /DNA_START=255 /DNA_END=1208 /DNA_ORIENTATION=+